MFLHLWAPVAMRNGLLDMEAGTVPPTKHPDCHLWEKWFKMHQYSRIQYMSY